MITKRKLRARIANLEIGRVSRDRAIEHQNHIIRGLRVEAKKYLKRIDALSAKIETYEGAYASAHECLLIASETLTGAYIEKIAAIGGDANVEANDDG